MFARLAQCVCAVAAVLALALSALAVNAEAGVTISAPTNGALLTDGTNVGYAGTGSDDGLLFDLSVNGTVRSGGPAGPITYTFSSNVDLGGGWSDAGAALLADGDYHLTVNQLGVLPEPDQTATSTFSIDSTAPNTVIDSHPAHPTASTTANFSFHATDNFPGPFTYECRRDGGAWASCSSPDAGTAAEGQRSFEVRATDGAGHVDPSPAQFNWIVDLTDPTISVTTPPTVTQGPGPGHKVSPSYLYESSVNPVFSCTDPLMGSPAAASGIASCTSTPPGNLPTGTLGNFLVTFNALDNVGHAATPVERAYRVDPPNYRQWVLNDGPIGYWQLGEDFGATTAVDQSSAHRDLTYKNGVRMHRPAAPSCQRRPHPPHACVYFANDAQDWSAYFPGRDGYAYHPTVPAPANAYSIEAWIRPADSSDRMIFGHGGAGQLFIKDGRLAVKTAWGPIVTGGPVLTPGSWYHVGASWSKASNTLRLYLNGAQIASGASSVQPSGNSSLYVGYGEAISNWFKGEIDEVAYYDHALPADQFEDRWAIGTASDPPSVPESVGNPAIDTTPPSESDIHSPVNNAQYAPNVPAKVNVPNLDFECADPDPAQAITNCSVEVDGNPLTNGSPLPSTPGEHTVVLSATNDAGLEWSHTHRYVVQPYRDIVLCTAPATACDAPNAYYRLNEAANATALVDESPGGHGGTFKNDQTQGGVGVTGDGNATRAFLGRGGYAYVNDIPGPVWQYTLESWVKLDDTGNAMIMQHGRGFGGNALAVVDGRFVFRHQDVQVAGPAAGPGAPSTSGPGAGGFHQIVGVWDGIDAILYVDGVERARSEALKLPAPDYGTFYLGYGELAPWLRGSLDEPAYYPRALSGAKVKQHYDADPPSDTGTAPTTGGSAPGPAGSAPTPTSHIPGAGGGPMDHLPPGVTPAPHTNIPPKGKGGKGKACKTKQQKRTKACKRAAKKKAAARKKRSR